MTDQPNNPLHGVTLEMMLRHLLTIYRWEDLYKLIRINCFLDNPSIKSSLTFLRKTAWARKKVEDLCLETWKPADIRLKMTGKETDEK